MCFKIVRFVGIRRGRELRLWERPDELARLWSQFEQITAGRLHVTLVVGNPGIGKAYRSRKSQGALTRSKLMSIEQPKEVGFGHHHARGVRAELIPNVSAPGESRCGEVEGHRNRARQA
jgi:hypothetical protein